MVIIGILATPFPGYAQAPPAINDKDLHALIDRLEDPKKRQMLVSDLKLIIGTPSAAQKPAVTGPKAPPPQKTKQLLLVESLFQRFEALSQRVMAAGANIFRLAFQTPRALRQVNAFFNQPAI